MTYQLEKFKGRWQELEDFYQSHYKLNENKDMNNGILKLDVNNVKSAVVYGVVAIALVIISQGTIFGLDWKQLADVGVVAVLTSLVKNLFTTNDGNFAGIIKTK